ncbi:MAG: FHA domain-containing protein [Synergistaceae bacterium]|jgi:hypothetical protein|nr:FHA domain-containing protein [Synergistaceae bacterium]
MSVNLFCLKGPYAGQEFPIEEHGIVLGRDPATASVILDVSSVSRSHANVFLSKDGRVILQDLRSTNGTFLIDSGGGKTKVQGDIPLSIGQKFSLGANDDIVFEVRSSPAVIPNAGETHPGGAVDGAPLHPSNASTVYRRCQDTGAWILAIVGFIMGMPLSYYFQNAIVQKIPFLEYIKVTPQILLYPFSGGGNESQVFSQMEANIAVTLWITCVVLAVIGFLLGYLFDILEHIRARLK